MAVSIEFLHQLVDRLTKGVAANKATPGRKGSVVHLDSTLASDVVIVGDLHGNRGNYQKVLKAANLAGQPRRHLVLQEVVHGGPTYPNGGCMSHLLLEDVVGLKLQYPERVHFLLCNHELAEALNTPLVKGGVSQNQIFALGLSHAYGKAADRVAELFHAFIRSSPLALRLKTGVFISHSIPDGKAMNAFDMKVFGRELLPMDLAPGGSAYAVVWGRDHDPVHAKRFAEMVRSTVLINGHEPTVAGWQSPNEHQLIFDASGSELYLCHVPADRAVSKGDLVERLVKL